SGTRVAPIREVGLLRTRRPVPAHPEGSSSMNQVRVLIADGDPMLQDLLSLMIEQDPQMKVVGKAEDGRTAIQLAARLVPDIVLMDDRLPLLDGLQALEQIVAVRPEARVLVMTGVACDERAVRAFRLGAR